MDFHHNFAVEGARAGLKCDFESAFLLLEKAIGAEPHRSNYWTVLGNLALGTGLVDDAAAHFSRSLDLDARDLQAHLGMIATALQRGDDGSGGTAHLNEMITEFGRLDHVDQTETIFLAAAIRADHSTIAVVLDTFGAEPPWEVAKLGAICHLINRYFPFGLGLDVPIGQLPHLSVNNLVASLFEVQRQDLSEWAARTSIKIAIVNSQPKNVFNDYPIFEAIRSAGHEAAYFMGPVESSTELLKAGMDLDGTYLIAGENLSECDVDLLFSTSPQAAHLSNNAGKVLIPHDIAGHPRGALSDEQSIEPIPDYALFDYFLTTNDRMAADLGAFIVENDQLLDRVDSMTLSKRRRSVRRLVPSGYSKLDYNIKQVKRVNTDNNVSSVLIFPTDYTVHPGGISPKIAQEVIEYLLNNFPDRQIIFRPHPNNNLNNSAGIRNIYESMKSNPRFEFDDDTNYLPVWARASVMVTDFSGGAMTFACTTGRPTLFFNPVDKSAQRAERGGILLFMDELGLTVETLEEVAPALTELLDPAGKWPQRIAAFNRSAVYNIGAAADYIASVIPQLLTDETPAGWAEL